MICPKIGIYVGNGASHSWIWFVDTFERFGLYDLSFLTEENIEDSLLNLDILAIGGGDTYTIAGALGPEKLSKISDFIKDGGFYIGTCAGAYLPLRSSKEMLSWFNVVEARINNLAKSLPEPKQMAEKYSVSYGCDLIYHPVRGPLKVQIDGRTIVAPLYGGPPMMAYEDVEELAHYKGFADETIFLVEKGIAGKTLFGKAAVVKKSLGNGCLYLYGPHFEHPQYPDANDEMLNTIKEVVVDGKKRPLHGEITPVSHDWLKGLKREISNSRIVANSIMMSPIKWKIGEKIWEPEKFSYFLDAIWKRLEYMKNNGSSESGSGSGGPKEMIRLSEETTVLLRGLRKNLKAGEDTTEIAEDAFYNLRVLTSGFLEIYFGCR
ncbi:MAG: BPL-N domain-containing protein, partial [Halobacteriota archaeon]|nr:BPL-N domain-containing protein [Halobacteriota archaeon]